MDQQLELGSAGQTSRSPVLRSLSQLQSDDKSAKGLLVSDGLTHTSGIWQAVNMGVVFLSLSHGWLDVSWLMPVCLSPSSNSFTWWLKITLFRNLLAFCLLVSHWPRKSYSQAHIQGVEKWRAPFDRRKFKDIVVIFYTEKYVHSLPLFSCLIIKYKYLTSALH